MEKLVEKFIEQLKSPDEKQRRYAAQDLGSFKDQTAVALLFECLKDPESSVAEAAVASLLIIGSEKVCRKAVELLYSDESHLRNYAVGILETIGKSDLQLISSFLKEEN